MTPVPYLDLPAQMRAIRKDIDAAIARTLDNCSFCLGPDVAQFEKDFARFCGAEHCVAFNSGTSALHVAMKLLNIGPGDEVITTPALSSRRAGPFPTSAPSRSLWMSMTRRSTWTRSWSSAPSRRAPRRSCPSISTAIPATWTRCWQICRKHNLPLVEDAAQAHGAKYRGKVVGTSA